MHLNDLELAWTVWTWMEATGWRFLPGAGGLLDQPDGLMRDLLAIAALSAGVKEETESDAG